MLLMALPAEVVSGTDFVILHDVGDPSLVVYE
jgi:hypothetical protein